MSLKINLCKFSVWTFNNTHSTFNKWDIFWVFVKWNLFAFLLAVRRPWLHQGSAASSSDSTTNDAWCVWTKMMDKLSLKSRGNLEIFLIACVMSNVGRRWKTSSSTLTHLSMMPSELRCRKFMKFSSTLLCARVSDEKATNFLCEKWTRKFATIFSLVLSSQVK